MISVRAYLEIAAVLMLGLTFWAYSAHERGVGENVIEKQDTTASASVQRKADAATESNIINAALASGELAREQKAVVDYIASLPVTPVRVCHPDAGGGGLPAARGLDARAAGAGAGRDSVQPVPGVTPGPDIGPALTELMLDAARLAGLYREFQERDAGPVR